MENTDRLKGSWEPCDVMQGETLHSSPPSLCSFVLRLCSSVSLGYIISSLSQMISYEMDKWYNEIPANKHRLDILLIMQA